MENIIEEKVADLLVNNFMPYTAYVIKDRALSDIDGFKPSQRRILYTMMTMGLLKGQRKKSQGIVGSTMFLHPHGDGAIYETLVRMSNDAEALLNPYIDSKGNFGKQYSREMQYASARYTEVRLNPIAKELFMDINKNTVDMIENYDGTLKEPKMLPVSFPTILTNPQIGIASGMASNIAPFNLNEVIDFTIAYIKNYKEAKVSDYIKAPDFPTGGNIIYDEALFEKIFETGRGSFNIRSTYRIEGNSIFFEELPYTTTYEAIMDKISDLVKEGKIKDIVDIHNNYGINTKGIEVVVKNSTNKEALIEKLFKLTPLQSTFPCNFNLLIDGMPKVLGIKGIIAEWVRFRANTVSRGLAFEADKKKDKMHVLKALHEVLLDVDKAISIIRNIKKNSEVVNALRNEFKIDKEQAEYVAEIKLRHLNKEYLLDRVAEIEVLKKEIKELDSILSSKKKIADLIVKQLEEIKEKFGKERKSNIITLNDIPSVEKETIEIDNYNVKIFLTEQGYLKKIPLTSLRGNFTIQVKEGDSIVAEYDTTNNSDILVFTDKQNVYKYKAYEIEDHKPSGLGKYIPSLLDLSNEEILYTTVTSDYTGNLVIGFDDGKVAKIELKAYETKQNRKMLTKAYADKKALLFKHIHEDIDILAISTLDKALVFNTDMINAKGSKTTIGVQAMKSKNESTVKEYHVLNSEFEETDYYRTASAGIGKYLKKEDFTSLLVQ